MKNFLRALKLLPKRLLIGPVVAIAAAVPLVFALSTSGAVEHIRYTQGMEGLNHPAFNVYYNVPNVGDEKNFLTGKIAGAPGGFYDPMTMVRNGDELLVRVYVHNGADPKHNASGKGVAKNTRVKVNLPTGITKSKQMAATISADNATAVTDTLNMSAENGGYFELDYVEGSANLKTNFTDRDLRSTQEAQMLSNEGVRIGDRSFDGEMRGCFEYVAVVTFKVKVKMPRMTIAKRVSVDSKNWHEQVTVKPGDTVEWEVEFKNAGTSKIDNVAIYDDLPKFMKIVPGTTQIYNGSYPNGVSAGSDAIVTNSIDIGNYLPGANAKVYFKSKVENAEELDCGVHKLTNLAYATPKGHGSVTDTASVIVDSGNDCEEEEQPVYRCDSLSIVDIDGREVSFKANETHRNGANFKHFVYDFGDKSDKFTTTDATVSHKYPKGEDNFTARVTAVFTVDGKDVSDTDSDCTAEVDFDQPDKEIVPPTGELPSTGPVDLLAGVFGTGALGAATHNWVASRRALKKSASLR